MYVCTQCVNEMVMDGCTSLYLLPTNLKSSVGQENDTACDSCVLGFTCTHTYAYTKFKIDGLIVTQLEEEVSVTARSADQGDNSRVSLSCFKMHWPTLHHTYSLVHMLVCMYTHPFICMILFFLNTDPVITWSPRPCLPERPNWVRQRNHCRVSDAAITRSCLAACFLARICMWHNKVVWI